MLRISLMKEYNSITYTARVDIHVYFSKEKKRKLIDIHLKSATTAIRQSGE